MKGMKSLGQFVEYEAKMIESILREEEIPVLLQQVDYALPVIMGSGGLYDVLVPEDEYERAKEIIERMKEG